MKDKLYISSSNYNNLEQVVKDYFDLYVNYVDIEKKISCIDENTSTAVKNTSGIRILNQPKFETLISYIISANNNIPRISKSVNEISKRYGKKVIFENEEYFLFPTVNELENVNEEEFRKCGVGFRAKYIVHTINDILNSKVDLNELSIIPTEEARKKLLTLMGIGPKVADCILLFTYDRKEVFPIDVWIKKIMEKLYFKQNVSLKDILEFAKLNYSEYAGIVQQHLFYNVREGLM
jgi:N-glycosylase/DNA lyase